MMDCIATVKFGSVVVSRLAGYRQLEAKYGDMNVWAGRIVYVPDIIVFAMVFMVFMVFMMVVTVIVRMYMVFMTAFVSVFEPNANARGRDNDEDRHRDQAFFR